MTAQAEEIPHRGRPASRRFARPTTGPGPAAKAVAEDASALIRAEIELAKAEISAAVKEKVAGAVFMVITAVLAWLGLQGLLITAGLALALVLPGWAAALIVSAVLLIIGGILALIGKRKLASPVSVETTKRNVEEDVAWTKAHLSKQ
jgi:uncharacterized membrane protein YqjE